MELPVSDRHRRVDTPSPLNLARVLLKTDSAAMEVSEVLMATPGSAKRRFRPTRWHPRRAGTERAPKASRCWRRHSSLASVCTRFPCDESSHRLSRGRIERRNLWEYSLMIH